jgi:hypothetical protein
MKDTFLDPKFACKVCDFPMNMAFTQFEVTVCVHKTTMEVSVHHCVIPLIYFAGVWLGLQWEWAAWFGKQHEPAESLPRA